MQAFITVVIAAAFGVIGSFAWDDAFLRDCVECSSLQGCEPDCSVMPSGSCNFDVVDTTSEDGECECNDSFDCVDAELYECYAHCKILVATPGHYKLDGGVCTAPPATNKVAIESTYEGCLNAMPTPQKIEVWAGAGCAGAAACTVEIEALCDFSPCANRFCE